MSSKQDRHGARNATDLEYRYNFGKSFAEVYNLISDVQKGTEGAVKELDEKLNSEEIFNRLTNYGKVQGIYRGKDGDVYVNATYIKSGKLAAEYIDADNLKVKAANITGTLKIESLPDDVAQVGDIPLKVSDLVNDVGYQNASGVTSIVGGVVTTDFVEALGIKVAAANITGTLKIGQLPSSVAETSDIPTNVSTLKNDAGYQTANGVTTIVKGTVTTDYVEALGIKVASANITGKLTANQIDATNLTAAKLSGDLINLTSAAGDVFGQMSVTNTKMMYILSGVASGFLLGGTDANPLVTCLGTFYAENVIADNIQTYLDAFETRISRLERLFG